MTDQTADFVAQLASGDSRAVESLLQHYLPELNAFVRLRMGTMLSAKETTDDLVQSVCREVLEGIDDFDYRGEREFKAWLFHHAQKKVANRVRFYGRKQRDAGREMQYLTDVQVASGYRSLLSPSRAAIRKEEIEKLEQAFDELPEDYREAITCAKILGLSHAEIAERMGRSPSATRVLLHRAMVRLAFLLEAETD